MNAIAPEILLMVLGFLLMGADLLLRAANTGTRASLFHITWMGLAAALVLAFSTPDIIPVYIGDIYKVDGFGLWMRRIFIASTLFAVLLSRPYVTIGANGQRPMSHAPEYGYIMIFCTVGMIVVVSAMDLMTLFVGLEIATVPLYILAGYNKRDVQSAEAGVKYIMTGSMSTAFMLFAFSYLYGVCGSTRLSDIAVFATAHPDHVLLMAGVTFMISGIGFKLAMAPFHMWAPDVYAGAPAPTVAFLSVSSKAVAAAFLLMMFFGPLNALLPDVRTAMMFLSGATMVVGNLGALRQRQIRRFIAYSSISQAGYLLMVFLGEESLARTAAIYYLLIYGAANYAFFVIAAIVGRRRGESFDALRGLAKASPGLAAALAVSMFSLAGIPPAAGFFGKFMIFASVAETGHYGFIVFAALNSTVSLYYYLLVIREAYIVAPAEGTPPVDVDMLPSQRIALILLTAATLLLGLIPSISTSIQTLVK